MTAEQETSKNLDRYNPLKYSEQNINIDKETLNLFKGIVKKKLWYQIKKLIKHQ